MSVTKIGPSELLEYSPRYGVLICRECHYAIQKSAMESHLLRHRIYRDERQNLLSAIAQLDLFEPDNVPLPTPDTPPIDGLPILHGYRCSIQGCGTLFASERRMKHHQRQMHTGDSSCFAHTVKLQTFFRGTKIRYFEVSEVIYTETSIHGAVAQAISENIGDVHMDGDEELVQAPPKSFHANIDLGILTCFHHFTTTTSLTLPITKNLQSTTQYWQTEIVLQALQKQWLMCGLLALSASHLATFSEETTIEKTHSERSAQFFAEFSGGWNEARQHDLGVIPSRSDEEAMKAGEQVDRILCCIYWKQNPFQLHAIMTTLRRFGKPDFTTSFSNSQSDGHDHDRQMEAFAQASRVTSSSNTSDGELPIILSHLSSLPSRMTEVFGRPESPQGVLATISAIAILVECCEVSFQSDGKEIAFEGMTRWLGKISDRFYHMISVTDPAALVVLAHWASFLVERAENCGCWFLKGLAKKILLGICECLPADAPVVFGLIEDLMR